MRRDRYIVRFRAALVFAVISLAVMLAAPLLERWPGIVGLAAAGAVACTGLALSRSRERALGVRPALALGLLLLVHVGFWRAFGQASDVTLALVGERSPSLAAPELLILALAPLSAGVWAVLGRHGLEPSTVAKFSIGFVLLAASWFCLGVGIEWGAPASGLLAICVSLLAVAALCIGPASLLAVDELGGGERAWLAMWLLGYVLARGVGASTLSGAELVERCAAVGLGCVVAGVGMAFVWRPITSLADAVAVAPHFTADSSLGCWPEETPGAGRPSVPGRP